MSIDTETQNVRIVPLAKVVRFHGFPKNQISTYKADLFNPGGELFKNRKSVYVGYFPSTKNQHPKAPKNLAPNLSPNLSTVEWSREPTTLLESCSPHGGAWGQATGILLKVSESAPLTIPCLIGLPRAEFPPLTKGFYICDAMGLDVVDEDKNKVGVITGYYETASGNRPGGGAYNLIMKDAKTARLIEFPIEWVESDGTQPGPGTVLCVPQIAQWREL